MKKLIILLLLLSASIAGYSQTGFSGVFLRVQDSAAYVNSSNTIAKHSAGYADIWYSDVSNLFWKWNGSSYEAFGASSIDGHPAMTSYASSQTLTLGDYNSFNNQGITRWTISGPANLTVPLDATADFNDGAQIGIDNQGSDTLTVVWTGGVTGNDGGYVEIFPGGSALLIKVGTNEWDLLGTQPGGGGTSALITKETPAGMVNGSNVTFTLSADPDGTENIFKNGLLMKAGDDYTMSGVTLTFTTAPLTGDILTAVFNISGSSGGGSVNSVVGTTPISVNSGDPANPVVSISNAAADGTTKGASSYTASDFDAASGVVSIDYTNGQAASGSTKGFVTSADWTTFNGKVSSVGLLSGTSGTDVNITGSPVTGSGSITLNIPDASATARGLVTTGTQTIAGSKTFSGGVISGSATNGVSLSNASGLIAFTNSSTTQNLAFSSSNNLFYTGIKWQFPRLQFSTSSTDDTNASYIEGAGGQTTINNRSSSAANYIGLNIVTNNISTYGPHNYSMLNIANNSAFNNASGVAGFYGVVLTPTYNTSGGTNTLYGFLYQPVETSMTGSTHYGIVSTSATARSGFGITTPAVTLHTVGTMRYDAGSDATGDILYRNSSSNLARLGVGSTNDVLTVSSGLPSWTTPSGTYTPTLTNTTNIDASTAYVTGWYRIGTMVTVFGKVDIDATLSASAATELGVSLPVASNMTGEQDLGGTAISDSVASLAARIKGDATNDRASIVFKAISLTNDSYSFEFSYQIK